MRSRLDRSFKHSTSEGGVRYINTFEWFQALNAVKDDITAFIKKKKNTDFPIINYC